MDAFRKAEKRKEKERNKSKLSEDPSYKAKSKFPKLATEQAKPAVKSQQNNLIELPEEGEPLDEVALIYDILDVEEIDLRKGGFNPLPARPVALVASTGIVSRGEVVNAVIDVIEEKPVQQAEVVMIESAPVMRDLIKASAVFVPANVKRKLAKNE